MKDKVDKLIAGSVDSHLHVAPDPYRQRIADAYEVAYEAANIGMKGVVLKSHDYPTSPLAQLAQKNVDGIEILGSLTLNHGVGGNAL